MVMCFDLTYCELSGYQKRIDRIKGGMIDARDVCVCDLDDCYYTKRGRDMVQVMIQYTVVVNMRTGERVEWCCCIK